MNMEHKPVKLTDEEREQWTLVVGLLRGVAFLTIPWIFFLRWWLIDAARSGDVYTAVGFIVIFSIVIVGGSVIYAFKSAARKTK